MQSINIVVFTREYPGESAGAKRIHHLLNYLRSKEVNITVISIRNKYKLENEKGKFNSVDYIRLGSELILSFNTFYKFIKLFFDIVLHIIRLKKTGFKNVVYNYGGVNIENVIYLIIAKMLGYKLIFDIVEDYSAFTDDYKLISRFKFWTIRKMDKLNVTLSDAIIVISTFLKKKYEFMNAKNLTLIPITSKVNENLSRITDSKKVFQISYAGSFGDKDGVDLIVSGFIEFNLKYPESKLYLIGSGEHQKKYFDKYGQIRNIVFTGFISDDQYYSLIDNSDVLCMCRTGSHFANAGFPFKLGEYLATGNPVIATKVSDVELYLDDNSALLIEPDNVQQFLDKLIWIKEHKKDALIIGLNGLDVCRSFFSIDKCGGKLLKLIAYL